LRFFEVKMISRDVQKCTRSYDESYRNWNCDTLKTLINESLMTGWDQALLICFKSTARWMLSVAKGMNQSL
jgi:hypothetical protein